MELPLRSPSYPLLESSYLLREPAALKKEAKKRMTSRTTIYAGISSTLPAKRVSLSILATLYLVLTSPLDVSLLRMTMTLLRRWSLGSKRLRSSMLGSRKSTGPKRAERGKKMVSGLSDRREVWTLERVHFGTAEEILLELEKGFDIY